MSYGKYDSHVQDKLDFDLVSKALDQRDAAKKEYIDSLPSWIPPSFKHRAFEIYEELRKHQNFTKKQVKKFIEQFPEIAIPGSVLDSYAFLYFIRELYILEAAIKAGEDEGINLLLGTAEYYLFKKIAGGWKIGSVHNPIVIKSQLRGFKYIRYLIYRPNEAFSPLDLYQRVNQVGSLITPEQVGSLVGGLYQANLRIRGEVSSRDLDPSEKKTRNNYSARLKEISTRIKQIRADQKDPPLKGFDPDKLREEKESLDDEAEFILKELDRFTQYSPDKGRRPGVKEYTQAEKSRANVTTQIHDAIKKIRTGSPELAEFINDRLSTGHSIVYTPFTGDPPWLKTA